MTPSATLEQRANSLEQASAAGCRHCGAVLGAPVLDLGASPLCQSIRRQDQADQPETYYPLRVFFCPECQLVQLSQFVQPEEIFCHYPYFSSYSDSWVRHAKRYAEMAMQRFGLNASSQVVEIASNDGYLLQHFVKRGVPVLGIEPAANVAEAAREKGVPTLVRFFGEETASEVVAEGKQADLIVANNVLAHVPDLNGFVAGLAILLKPGGVLTIEFPHLMRLLEENQFDTIYHEHFCYFSLATASRVLAAHGLQVFDVEELASHGGSLRLFVCHAGSQARPVVAEVKRVLAEEQAAGLERRETYENFAEQVKEIKRGLLEFLIDARRAGKQVVGYGAPGKAVTLLNYCGIGCDFLDYTVDRSPHKQGLVLPGTGIPIHGPERIFETRPDYVLILPWNLRREIARQMAGIAQWQGRFVVPIPQVEVFEGEVESSSQPGDEQ